jgi:hypothetical protein
LKQLLGRTCSSAFEQYQLLDERDKILYKARVKLTDVESAHVVQVRYRSLSHTEIVRGCVQGTCQDMCPEKERYVRIVQKRLSAFECDENGGIIHRLTVKDYSRSAADQVWERGRQIALGGKEMARAVAGRTPAARAAIGPGADSHDELSHRTGI